MVIVFLKSPEKGQVKTRLSRLSGMFNETDVLRLYKGFVIDILDILSDIPDKMICFWPPQKENEIKHWLSNENRFLAQHGETLGKRMANAFEDVFEQGYTKALLIGTDIPELDETIIENAYHGLESNDAVIGPSTDGGYYLIGFTKDKFSVNLFKGIDWSSNAVLDQTLEKMAENSIHYKKMTTLNDIDTPQDLIDLTQRIHSGARVGPNTLKFLSDKALADKIY